MLRIKKVEELDRLVGEEPAIVQVTNVFGTYTGVLTGVYKDGRFDIYSPGAPNEEMTFFLSDCIVCEAA